MQRARLLFFCSRRICLYNQNCSSVCVERYKEKTRAEQLMNVMHSNAYAEREREREHGRKKK